MRAIIAAVAAIVLWVIMEKVSAFSPKYSDAIDLIDVLYYFINSPYKIGDY